MGGEVRWEKITEWASEVLLCDTELNEGFAR